MFENNLSTLFFDSSPDQSWAARGLSLSPAPSLDLGPSENRSSCTKTSIVVVFVVVFVVFLINE